LPVVAIPWQLAISQATIADFNGRVRKQHDLIAR
jgi:hypothetical protein